MGIRCRGPFDEPPFQGASLPPNPAPVKGAQKTQRTAFVGEMMPWRVKPHVSQRIQVPQTTGKLPCPGLGLLDPPSSFVGSPTFSNWSTQKEFGTLRIPVERAATLRSKASKKGRHPETRKPPPFCEWFPPYTKQNGFRGSKRLTWVAFCGCHNATTNEWRKWCFSFGLPTAPSLPECH